jgi:hypothetical protein
MPTLTLATILKAINFEEAARAALRIGRYLYDQRELRRVDAQWPVHMLQDEILSYGLAVRLTGELGRPVAIQEGLSVWRSDATGHDIGGITLLPKGVGGADYGFVCFAPQHADWIWDLLTELGGEHHPLPEPLAQSARRDGSERRHWQPVAWKARLELVRYLRSEAEWPRVSEVGRG